jgi:PHD/YefM family antitoxin component YafN of YafNO toxin-antitoxin module
MNEEELDALTFRLECHLRELEEALQRLMDTLRESAAWTA